MTGTVAAVLPAQVRSVPRARRLVQETLSDVGAEHLRDQAALAVSELVTNAVVHAGSAVQVRVVAVPDGVRVEVSDASPHLPTLRDYALTSGTGRGLRLVERTVDRWGVVPDAEGKTVWFEIGRELGSPGGPAPARARSVPTATIRLRDVPLLMHWAWQEHAQSLLREYLLFGVEGDPSVLDRHAQASEALAVLHEQVPRPQLPDDPESLLADTLDPTVTAAELRVDVPVSSVPHFATLDAVLARAVQAANAGEFLGPPTQPEISEMRSWLCTEVTRQASGQQPPQPWRTRTDVRAPVAGGEDLLERYAELTEAGHDVIVADEASVIVAVSPSVARFLGYGDTGDLLGRRIILVVPQRYHQAHIAGTTLNATNGRDKLLDTRLTVPVVRADGTEVAIGLCVTPRQLGDRRVFVADLALPPGA
jgi:PAS domain S-box-containing protein